MNPATTHGAFSWSELMAPDAKAAAEFYAKVLGYTVNTQEMENGPYHMLMDGRMPRAGAMDLPDPSIPPNWSFYITVDDVDATAEKAKQLGAKQEWPFMDVPDVGRMTGFTDPQGAYFAIITYSYPPMEGPGPKFEDSFVTHGAFSWFELRTPDPEASKEFYKALFGWNIKPWPMGDGNTYDTINVGETGVGGIIPLPSPEVPPHWGGYITVDDSDAVAEAAQEAGGTVTLTMDMPQVGRFHAIQDPQGAVVCVIKYYPPPESQG